MERAPMHATPMDKVLEPRFSPRQGRGGCGWRCSVFARPRTHFRPAVYTGR